VKKKRERLSVVPSFKACIITYGDYIGLAEKATEKGIEAIKKKSRGMHQFKKGDTMILSCPRGVDILATFADLQKEEQLLTLAKARLALDIYTNQELWKCEEVGATTARVWLGRAGISSEVSSIPARIYNSEGMPILSQNHLDAVACKYSNILNEKEADELFGTGRAWITEIST